MGFFKALVFCVAVQLVRFYPFFRVWKADREKYGNDLGVPLWKRFAAWLVMFPVWALPVVEIIRR